MDEINRVARLMVDAEPAADLDARIRARLDEISAAPVRRAWRAWQIAAGVGAAAAIALLVWVPGPGSRVLGPESRVLGPESGSLPVAASDISANRPLPSGISPLVTLPPLRHSTGSQRAQSSALSAEELAWMERRIPALDPVVALEMDQLAMESIQPEPLAIPPLIMTALPTDGGTTERRER